MTETPAQHPWAKYYSERGVARPAMVDLPRPAPNRTRASRSNRGPTAGASAPAPISAELAAAIAVVTAQAAPVESTAAPFITAMQREAVARELKRRARWRMARLAVMSAAVLLGLHLVVTRFFVAEPTESAVQARVERIPEAILPLFSSSRQPLQIDGVTIAQADRINAGHYRYVASVTLRLRKPLYVPANTNGTANYRRLQEAVYRARDLDVRMKLFAGAESPEPPSLPLLLRRVHQAGESIVVRVPFNARRFGWHWRVEEAQVALRAVNRVLEGDSLERYADTPHLMFGTPATLAEVRRRTKLAQDYVQAVAKEVQRNAHFEAVATPAGPSLGDLPALDLANAPAVDAVADKVAQVEGTAAVDPNAPAIVLPESPRFLSGPPRTARR